MTLPLLLFFVTSRRQSSAPSPGSASRSRPIPQKIFPHKSCRVGNVAFLWTKKLITTGEECGLDPANGSSHNFLNGFKGHKLLPRETDLYEMSEKHLWDGEQHKCGMLNEDKWNLVAMPRLSFLPPRIKGWIWSYPRRDPVVGILRFSLRVSNTASGNTNTCLGSKRTESLCVCDPERWRSSSAGTLIGWYAAQ